MRLCRNVVPILVAVAIGVLSPTVGAAQVLVGRVVDADSRERIAGADLEVRNADSVAVSRATSDSTGLLRAALPSDGAFYVVVSRIGYAPYRSTLIPAIAGESIELEIRLGRDAVPLEPLVVVARATRSARLAGYRQRLAQGGFGSFVTREEIERRPAASVTDLIRPLPGVDIVEVARVADPNLLSALIAMRGTRGGEIAGTGGANWCLPGLFLDGIPIEQSTEFPVDDLLSSASLEGIEVYSSAGSVPIEFQRGGSVACGAVLLWTREAQLGEGRSGWWRWALGIGGFVGILFFML